MLGTLLGQASPVAAAWVVAIATVIAAVIYLLTFRSVNEQTKISREQLAAAREQLQASRAQLEERYEPRLKVEVIAYIPSEASMKDTMGRLKILLTNLGGATLQELKMTAVSRGNPYSLLEPRSTLSVFPGSPQEVVGPFYIPSVTARWSIETTCTFETGNGKKWKQWDSWELDLSNDRILERRLLNSELTAL
jgi:hypothetical protein